MASPELNIQLLIWWSFSTSWLLLSAVIVKLMLYTLIFLYTFDLVPHNMLLHKLGSFGFSDGYVSWFRSYLTNRPSRVRVCGTLSQPFQVTSGVPKGSVLGPFLFNLFINDLCSSVQYCKLLIFADDVKIFRVINSPHDCLVLQSDINCLSGWCIANSMRLNNAKARLVSQTNLLTYNYQFCHATITRTSSIKDLGLFFDSNYIFTIKSIMYFLNVLSF
jgi:hypothetical protein